MTQILIKRSATSGSAPASLAVGEIAINLADGLLFWADSGNSIRSTPLKNLALLASPAFTGAPTAPTQAAGDNSTKLSTTAFVATAIANLVASAPGTLDTLNELATALNDDPNFATTMATALGNRLQFDVAQALSDAQKTQAWRNLAYPAPLSITADTVLTGTAMARDIRVPSTVTSVVTINLTLPAVDATIAAGWSTGYVISEASWATLNVNVPSGATLDGTLNGSRLVFPRQRVLFYYDTDGWHTRVVERNPQFASVNANASPANAFVFALPAGYLSFDIEAVGMFSTGGNLGAFGVRFAQNATPTFDVTSGHYGYSGLQTRSDLAATTYPNAATAFMVMAASLGNTTNSSFDTTGVLAFPYGSASPSAEMLANTWCFDGSTYAYIENFRSYFSPGSGTRPQYIELIATGGGTLNAGHIYIRGRA